MNPKYPTQFTRMANQMHRQYQYRKYTHSILELQHDKKVGPHSGLYYQLKASSGIITMEAQPYADTIH